jgi:ATP-dependent Clp protease ATP-binding subunit ClpA
MIELEQDLEKRLKQSRVRIDVSDSDTLFLRNVPARKGCFNKARTNLLIKRPGAGQPFLVCVDEDLEYTGADDQLLRAFTAAHRQQGWRVIYLEQARQEDARVAIENALRVLGFDGEEPVLSRAPDGAMQTQGVQGRLLASFGTDLSGQVRDGTLEPTIGHEEKIEAVLAALLQWQARLPLIAGKSGVGKTNLLYGVARRLNDLQPQRKVVAVDLGILMAGTLFDSERENLLSALFKEALAVPGTVLAMEHLELALAGVPRGPWMLAQALEQGLKLIGTALDSLSLDVDPLARRIQAVELNEPWPEEMTLMLMALRDRIAQHHRVRIDEAVVEAALKNAQWIAGCLPATAINLLDAAAAKAALAGRQEVALSDIYYCISIFPQSAARE